MQIACTVADYKYSLHGLPEDSDEYLRKLHEVFPRFSRSVLQQLLSRCFFCFVFVWLWRNDRNSLQIKEFSVLPSVKVGDLRKAINYLCMLAVWKVCLVALEREGKKKEKKEEKSKEIVLC